MRGRKSIGESIEREICEGVGFEHVEGDDYYDAVVSTPIDTSNIDAPFEVRAYDTLHLPAGTKVEIKACCKTTSNGDSDTPGRWFFKGRKTGQHAKLLEEGAFYVLAVYGIDGVEVAIIVPAEHLDRIVSADSWYDVSRCEGTAAQLAWTRVTDQ